MIFSENWVSPKKILVVLAHPDDPEFFCGGSIARWIKHGHIVNYCLLTRGDKGTHDSNYSANDLAVIREKEQKAAAAVLGVNNVFFGDYQDGYLVPSLDARRDVIRMIRKNKPDILVSCDPTNIFPNDERINHPDHRAVGQIVVDAVFPGAGSFLYFPELLEEGLEPHVVKEVWLSVTGQPNVVLDITEFWETKLKALHEHRSQIGDQEKFDERMRNRRNPDSSAEMPKYEERYRRIVLMS